MRRRRSRSRRRRRKNVGTKRILMNRREERIRVSRVKES